MNIIHLRYALSIAETGSVTRAAEQLFVAQPNISRAIRELENSIGFAIFRRTSQGMEATEEGQVFLNHAKKIVEEIDRFKNEYECGRKPHIFFSVASHGARYAAEAFADFAASRVAEAFSFVFTEKGSQNAISSVSQGISGMGLIRFLKQDAAMVRRILSANELTMEPLLEMPLFYTAAARSHLALLPQVTDEELAPLTEITGETILRTDKAQKEKNRIRIFDRESRILALSKAADTYMLSTGKPAAYLKENGLVQRPAKEEGFVVQDAVIFREKHIRTRLEKEFLSWAAEKAAVYNK